MNWRILPALGLLACGTVDFNTVCGKASICELGVEDLDVQLESVYDEIPEMETSVSILEDGGVRIQHDNIGDACCPEVIVEAVADLTQKSIDLTMRTYECGNPCLYNLSVGYTLYGVPSGDWTVHANRGDFSFSK